ncbi:hypothetical protein Tco_1257883 [Tanacetum coccineum]
MASQSNSTTAAAGSSSAPWLHQTYKQSKPLSFERLQPLLNVRQHEKSSMYSLLAFILKDSNSTLKNHLTHPHCEALKRVVESGQSSMSRDGSIFVYNPDVLREQFADHLDAQERKQDRSTLETPIDFEEEVLDAEVQANEAILLSDEEIALDAASSEGSMFGPGSGGEEAEVEPNYGYDIMMITNCRL